MAPAGMHYLDVIFSAIRDATRHLAEAETWLSRAEAAAETRASEAKWEMSLLSAAREAHDAARAKLATLDAELVALAPSGRLPALLDELPSRLAAMRERLVASEERLVRVALSASSRPLGVA